MKKKFIKGFENSKKVVENLLKDKEAASKLLDQAIKKTEENRDRLMQIKDELALLLRMLKAWIKGIIGIFHGKHWSLVLLLFYIL
ncbi:MAG: hypothetical protein R3B45_17600 [Bdellovibrionota bacterium]